MRATKLDKDLSRFEYVVKYFAYDNGDLFRFFRGCEWRLVTNEPDKKGYVHLLIATGEARERGYTSETVKAHQVVWMLHNGDIPQNMCIDHINGNRSDNRIENLRLVSVRGNAQNQEVHRKGRLLGAQKDRERNCWKSSIKVNGKLIQLGRFETELEAHNAYLSACKELT